MRKLLFLSIIIFSNLNTSYSQEWFTSFEVAKRFATVQNKMLFVIWEDALNEAYPIAVNNENGKEIFLDLSINNEADALIWEHFIPVLLPEDQYDNFYKVAQNNRTVSYIDKLNDGSIKIMDINGNILNTKVNYQGYDNLSYLIKRYALNTSFLKQDLVNYSQQKIFTTAFNLATKYIDFSILVDRLVRQEVLKLGDIYLNDAKKLFDPNAIKNAKNYLQRLDLTSIKMDLVLQKTRKASRLLKKIDTDQLADFNKSLYYSLKYITFKSSNEDEKADLLKTEISSSDLKKAEFILKNNN